MDSRDICKRIEEAFDGVKLGGGIGLWEAQGLDGYCDAAQCAKLRERDEKADWRKIGAQDLNRCYSSVSFFDAEGMRFHLPAYMSLDLRGGYEYDEMDYLLSQTVFYNRAVFSLLDSRQKAAVRLYLEHMLERMYKELLDIDFEDYSIHHIERSIKEFWALPS